jgi:hypothetical protein
MYLPDDEKQHGQLRPVLTLWPRWIDADELQNEISAVDFIPAEVVFEWAVRIPRTWRSMRCLVVPSRTRAQLLPGRNGTPVCLCSIPVSRASASRTTCGMIRAFSWRLYARSKRFAS